MRAAATIGVVIVLTGPLAADPASDRAHRAKIVRVERATAQTRSILFCDVKDSGGSCFGPEAPKRGDRVDVVDDKQRLAQLRVSSVEPKSGRDGTCAIMWDVRYEPVSGSLSTTSARSNQLTGVIGLPIEAGGHKLGTENKVKIPSTYTNGSDQTVVIAIDRDGDDNVDLAVSFYQCGGTSGGRAGYGEFCVDVWSVANEHSSREPQYRRIQQITQQQLEPCLH